MIYACALCGASYDLDQPRRTTRYCETCRTRRTDEKHRLRNVARRRARDNVADVLNDYTKQGMSEDYVALMVDRLDDAVDETMPVEREHPELPIPGALTPAGPDEGATTGWSDLQAVLDERAYVAMVDPWWAAHPEWSDLLALDDVDQYLSAA